MAVTKIWKINGWIGDCLLYIENPNKTQNPLVIGDPKLKEEEYQSLIDVIEYAEDGNKTVRDTERFVSGVNCDAETARQEMILAKNAFDKNDGICAYHAIQSFAPGEVTPETAHEIGIRLAKEMWGERYQVLVATHLDHEHIHNHFVINSVSFLDGKRLWKEKNYWQMRTVSDALCREYGLWLDAGADTQRKTIVPSKWYDITQTDAGEKLTLKGTIYNTLAICRITLNQIDELKIVEQQGVTGIHYDREARAYLVQSGQMEELCFATPRLKHWPKKILRWFFRRMRKQRCRIHRQMRSLQNVQRILYAYILAFCRRKCVCASRRRSAQIKLKICCERYPQRRASQHKKLW